MILLGLSIKRLFRCHFGKLLIKPIDILDIPEDLVLGVCVLLLSGIPNGLSLVPLNLHLLVDRSFFVSQLRITGLLDGNFFLFVVPILGFLPSLHKLFFA